MKKTLIMMLCSLLVISSAAMGSVAYLTYTTDELINEFTVGDVTLKLDETLVDKYGDPVDEAGNAIAPGGEFVRTTQGNKYHLLPGESYVKDPTVTIDKNSEDSYVRLLVTVTKAKELDALCKAMTKADPGKYPLGLPQDHAGGFNTAAWIYETESVDSVANTVTYEFRYYDMAKKTDIVTPNGEDVVLPPLFESITVPNGITGADLKTIKDFEIKVVANAIQAHGFANADEAWAAFAPVTTAVVGE